jgi:hypothetical protein
MFKTFTVGFAVLATVLGLSAIAAQAQSTEVKEKAPMYSYIANWTIPRTQWGDMAKALSADNSTMEKAIADGTLVAYGDDTTLIHTVDGETNDDWFSSNSMAGLMNVLDQLYRSGSATNPVLSTATKHWDEVVEARYYNWKSGTYKGAYTHVGVYKLKADAPDDAVKMLSKNLVVPLLEKLLGDGTIVEYEIDTQAVHTTTPGYFLIVYISPNAEGLDKVNASVEAAIKANPLGGVAFGSMEDFSAHRDELLHTNATFK